MGNKDKKGGFVMYFFCWVFSSVFLLFMGNLSSEIVFIGLGLSVLSVIVGTIIGLFTKIEDKRDEKSKKNKFSDKNFSVNTILDETTAKIETTEQKESAQEWLDDLLVILQYDDKELDESDFPRISFRKPEELFADEENL